MHPYPAPLDGDLSDLRHEAAEGLGHRDAMGMPGRQGLAAMWSFT
jgi:hypothetical protein